MQRERAVGELTESAKAGIDKMTAFERAKFLLLVEQTFDFLPRLPEEERVRLQTVVREKDPERLQTLVVQ